jgi:hypothetical protein
MGLGMEAKTRWQLKPHTSPMFVFFEFLQGEWGDMQITIEWNISKHLSLQKDVKKPTIKNHLGHTWYGFKTYKPFPLVKKMETMFCMYKCGYGPKDHHKDPNHMRSIKHGCLAHFSIKRLYTWPNVVEIIFYHQIHTQANGDPIHGACDSGSTLGMSTYAPSMSHKLKEFIWTQLRYTVKQIYDNHK